MQQQELIAFGTEVYDTDNTFASSRFTPGVAGTYKIYCGIQVGTASTAYGAVVIVDFNYIKMVQV